MVQHAQFTTSDHRIGTFSNSVLIWQLQLLSYPTPAVQCHSTQTERRMQTPWGQADETAVFLAPMMIPKTAICIITYRVMYKECRGEGRVERKRKCHLKIFIKVEVSTVLVLLLFLAVRLLLVGASHDTSLLIVTDTLLEEVGLSGQ